MAPEETPKADKGFTVRDRRTWLQPDADLDELAKDGQGPRRPSAVEDLEARLADKDRQLHELIVAHKDASAEMDQVRQRLQRDVERRVELERARLAEPFVEALGDLARLLEAARAEPVRDPGAAALREGAELLARKLHDRLQALGLRKIEAQGQRFDPRTMEALTTAPAGPGQAGLVIQVLRQGYLLGDQVVSPAGVVVGAEQEG
ncbi:MAG TPA: nucleotide exchange factor GrpE [Myxococcota bacterium]|nr:nucleotide exchange factor GrpE [Myxococcota bacterium]HRY94695.1 nucleotide exchange factor GrpE [Myxococcota bacterium]HSA20267.1 nucleotide exchange factor GrpE [Myxococcota bacterium]